jgi:hypothetical protein
VTTAIAAFAGWNDAGSAATDALRRLTEALEAEVVFSIPPDEYCDLQVNRPIVRSGSRGRRQIVWPSTDFMTATLPSGRKLLFILGVEPSLRWLAFSEEVIRKLEEHRVETLWLLGALLADVPHTRPLKVQASSQTPGLRRRFGAVKPTYEGPAGIVTVLGQRAWERSKIPTGSLWVPVPHYAGSPPSPKAELALLTRIGEILDFDGLETADIEAEADDWAQNIDTLAQSEPDIAGYVASLEETFDTLDSPEGSGEALAKEFERYLRRHGS